MRDESEATMPLGKGEAYPYDQSIAQVETLTEPPQSNVPMRPRLAPRWMRILGLALPLVSALTLIVAMWMPWETLRIVYTSGGMGTPGGPSFVSEFAITGSEGLGMMLIQARPSLAYPTLRWLALLWNIVPLLSLLIGLFLVRVQQASRTLAALFGVWLLLTTAIMLPAIYGLMNTIAPLQCWQTCTAMPVNSRRPEMGIWLAIGGLALGLLIRQRSGVTIVRSVTPARYSTLHKVGAGVIILGTIIWALGLFAVPWATSGCTGLQLSLNHFVRGTCSGVDGWDAFTAGMGRNNWLAMLFLEVVPIMTLYVLIDVWLPRLTRSTWVVAACWSLLLTLLFLVGMGGVRATLAHPPVFTSLAQDPWVASQGIVVCALGILLSWIGGMFLCRTEVAQARQSP